jgi:hypothetical protein
MLFDLVCRWLRISKYYRGSINKKHDVIKATFHQREMCFRNMKSNLKTYRAIDWVMIWI